MYFIADKVLLLQLPLTVFFFRMRLADSEQYQKHAIQKKVPYWLAMLLGLVPLRLRRLPLKPSGADARLGLFFQPDAAE